MPITTVGRIKLCYQREGAGPPILFISGLSGDKNGWAPVVEQLKHQYECITFDNRGIGQSSRPRSGYTIPDLTRDTLGLLDGLSISRAHILGMSMGGMIAQSMALQRPELVGGLVLVGSFAAPNSRLMHVLKARKFMQRRMKRYEYIWALAAWMFGPEALDKPAFIDAFARKVADNPHPQALHAFDQLVDGIGQFDNRAQLKEIRQPTLMMVGEHDILTPPHLSRILVEGIPDAELVVLPGVGHFCHAENPIEFADRVASFLKRVDAR